jgi:hypothetical protein
MQPSELDHAPDKAKEEAEGPRPGKIAAPIVAGQTNAPVVGPFREGKPSVGQMAVS